MVGKGPRVAAPVARGTHVVFAVIDGRMVRAEVKYPELREVTLR